MQDYAELGYYQIENKKIIDSKKWPEVVFMGDSIIEGWHNLDPQFFLTHNYTARGIGGQTTFQMLLRMMQDVIKLKPKAMVLLGGTNDIAENSGTFSLENTFDNIQAMASIATAHQIEVIICSLLPVSKYPWNPEINPIPKIATLNDRLKDLSKKEGFIYVDLFSETVNKDRGLKKEFSEDGVHPNLVGYKTIQPLIVKGIDICIDHD